MAIYNVLSEIIKIINILIGRTLLTKKYASLRKKRINRSIDTFKKYSIRHF